MNHNDAKAVAHHIAGELSDDFTIRVECPGWDPPCYVIDNGHNRLGIGIDPIDGDGITWTTYFLTADGQADDVSCGGWAFGDDITAGREVSEIISFLCPQNACGLDANAQKQHQAI
jgi:hypothetical protein